MKQGIEHSTEYLKCRIKIDPFGDDKRIGIGQRRLYVKGMKRLFGASISLSRNWKKGNGYQLASGERKRYQSFLCEEERMNW